MLHRIWEVIKNRHDAIQDVILVCVGVMTFSLPNIQKYTLEYGQGKESCLPSAFPLKLKNSNPPRNIGPADMPGSVTHWLKLLNGHLNPYSSKYIFMALPPCLIFFIFSHSTHPTMQSQSNFFQILSLLQALVRALPSFWNIPCCNVTLPRPHSHTATSAVLPHITSSKTASLTPHVWLQCLPGKPPCLRVLTIVH